MAYELPFGKIGMLQAAGDLSGKQYYAAKVDTNGKADVAGAGVPIVGVIQNKPAAAGEAVEIVTDGVSKCVAGAAISVGASVTPDTNGKFVTATTGDYIAGIALVAAGGAGVVIPVLLKAQGISA